MSSPIAEVVERELPPSGTGGRRRTVPLHLAGKMTHETTVASHQQRLTSHRRLGFGGHETAVGGDPQVLATAGWPSNTGDWLPTAAHRAVLQDRPCQKPEYSVRTAPCR